ncbi:MAG TPA: carboxypeptidase regulatory-like domain-containing protein, partial [Bacteroidia bacterium]
MNLKIIFLFLSLLLAAVSHAQDTATVFGRITDADNAPVEDVIISISGSTQSPVFTDKAGNFTYAVPANKEVTIVFSNINYRQSQRKVKLAAGEKLDLSRSLTFKGVTFGTIDIEDENRFKELTRLDPINVTHIPTASQDFNA